MIQSAVAERGEWIVNFRFLISDLGFGIWCDDPVAAKNRRVVMYGTLRSAAPNRQSQIANHKSIITNHQSPPPVLTVAILHPRSYSISGRPELSDRGREHR